MSFLMDIAVQICIVLGITGLKRMWSYKKEAIIKTAILECLRRMQRCMNALSDFCLFDYYTCSLPCPKPIRLRYKARQLRGYLYFTRIIRKKINLLVYSL